MFSSAAEARAAGFKVDETCYPWLAYRGPRFNPIESITIPTDGEAGVVPVPMLLSCPSCRTQHVDRGTWTKVPHRSHLCHDCGVVWRPADVPTVGVGNIKTRGESDNWPVSDESDCVVCGRPHPRGDLLSPYSRVCPSCKDRWPDLALRLLTDQRLGPKVPSSYQSDHSRNLSPEDKSRITVEQSVVVDCDHGDKLS